MDPQYLAALEETLQQTFAPATVKLATARLSKEFYQNQLALPSLFHILQNSNQDQVKQLAAVEARKLISRKWEAVDASLKPQIKEALLQSTFTQENKLIRHSCARVVAAIAELELDKNSWPELLPALINVVGDANQQDMAVYTLYTLLETHNPALKEHQDDFVNLFANLLQSQCSRDVKVNATLSLDVLSQYLEEELDVKPATAEKFKSSVPGMVLVLKETISADDSEQTKSIFNVFNSLIFLDNKLLGDQIVGLIQFVVEIANNQSLDEDVRCMAMQFLISVVSMRKTKVSSNNLGPSLTLLALKIASEEIDEDDELNNEDVENENEENIPATLALRLMAILSGELPPSQVITPFFENLESHITSSDKFARRAALLCIGVASSGAPDFMGNQVKKIVPVVIRGLQDSEIVVKVAACRALAQLTSELQDNIAEFHKELLPLIVDVINNASHVMTYKHACFALDGVIEFMSHEAIADYVQPLMEKFFTMIQEANSSSLKAAIVSAIGSTAFASGKGFIPYFHQSVQALEPFIQNAAETEGMSEDDIELRAITFENISTMARAVGSESFSAYAKPLVEAAYAALNSDQLRIRESGFAFITNMAKVYGSEFSGFLDNIVPQILKCLNQEEFSFNLDENEAENFLEDEDEENLNEKFNVNTGITIEKEIASVALAELAMGTGSAFGKYVEESISTLAEQIEVSYGMREAAMNALWKIVRAMFKAQYGEDFKAPIGVPQQPYIDGPILELIKQARELTIANLEGEFEVSLAACDLDNIVEALNYFGAITVTSGPSDTASLEKLCGILMDLLKKEHPCQIDDEEPVEDAEDASETEAMMYETAVEVLILLSMKLGPDFVKIFETFKGIILANATSKSKGKRVGSIGALAEISVGLKASNPYAQELMQVFMDRLANDVSLEVKGNAAYGIGVLIELCPVDFTGQYQQILQMLFHLLSRSDKEGQVDDQETKDVVNRANANACGCVARMAQKNQAAIPLEHVLPALLSHLPLQSAPEENVPILKWIISLYESGNNLIAGQTDRVIQIFAEIFQKEAERLKLVAETTLGREEYLGKMKQFQSEEIKQKVIDLLKFLNQNYSSTIASHEILKSVIA